MAKTTSETLTAVWNNAYLSEGTESRTPFAILDVEPTIYLVHKDGSEQKIELIYAGLQEEGFGGKKIVYKEPMAVVRVLGVDIEKPWSIKTVAMRFLRYEYESVVKKDEK